MSYQQHQDDATSVRARCAVVTLSDTRTEATDKSGAKIRELLAAQGHVTAVYVVIPDDPDRLDEVLGRLESDREVEVILTNGGTGISKRDNTVPVIARHLVTEIPGFGELFRTLSYGQIQSGAMLSRALGGVARHSKLLFAMPGSTAAVELAMTKLILPELPHLLTELRK